MDRRLASTAMGALAAICVVELALHPFVSPMRLDEQPPAYLVRGSEIRQYQEGVATAHFLSDGSRSTGEPRIDGARNLVIIGDSQVEALQVEDTETMGAVVERRARMEGHAVNAVQLGRGGAGVPMYAGIASYVLRTWPTDRVVVVLNPSDFRPGALRAANFTVSVTADGRTAISTVPLVPSTGRIKRLLQRSSFLYMLWLRGKQIWKSAPSKEGPQALRTADQTAKVPDIVRVCVRALKQTYGERLAIVYTPYVGVGPSPIPPDESALLSTCAAEHVLCVSARDAMIRARDVDHALSRGFANTAPGVGHFNPAGHALLASVIWELVHSSQRGP